MEAFIRAPGEGVGSVGDGRAVGSGHDHQLARQAPVPLGTVHAHVLLECHVEVGSAEAEGAHTCTAGVIRRPDPGPRDGVDVKRGGLHLQLGVGPIDLDRGRQHLVVQRHHGLEQARSTGRCLAVADLALHGSQRAPLVLVAGVAEHEVEAAELSGVSRLGAGAVRLDELDRARIEAGVVVRPLQRRGLPFGDRRVHALGPAIGRRADPADHRVDAVAVALGVGQTLQRHHAQALAQHRAVGLIGERPAVTRRRERRGLAEAHEHEDLVQRVDAARDHQIAVAQVQLLGGHGQGRERGRTRSVGHAVRAAEIEPVGDPTGHDVAEQPREAALLPGRVVVGDAVADGDDIGLGHAVLTQRLLPHGLLEAAHHGGEQLLAGGDPEDHRHPRAVDRLELVARGVAEHLLCDDQAQQLRGVGRRHDARRHAPAHGVEVDVAEEASALGVGLVLRLGIGVIVVLGQPVRGWHVRDEVLAGEDVPPETCSVGGSRKEGRDPHHRQRGTGRHDRAIHQGSGERPLRRGGEDGSRRSKRAQARRRSGAGGRE